jgi:hypothetical protein
MDSHCGENVFVTLGDFDGYAIVLDRSDRADCDELVDAGRGGALDNRFDIIAELRVG